MPSYGGAHGPDGSKKTGDQGQGTRDKDGGNTGGGRSVGGSKSTGGKRIGSATVADHAIATGRIGAPSIPSGGVAKGNYPSQVDAYNDYSKAVGDYETRGFFGKALDFLGGSFYDQQEPMAGNPRSFAGGSYHSTSNPGGILGGLAGMAVPGLGMLAGPALGSAYTAAGLPLAWHGGLEQPDLRGGMFGNTSTPMGGTQAAANSAVGGGGWFSGLGGNMAGGHSGGYSPFGGTGNNQLSVKPQSNAMQQPQQAKAPVSSSLPGAAKFPGFPNYGSYSPFSNSQWSWG